jgi:hypothetical protein
VVIERSHEAHVDAKAVAARWEAALSSGVSKLTWGTIYS